MSSRACAIAVALLLASSSALADTPADLETARLYLHQGNDLREKGDLRGALAKYKAAHALAYTPITGLEVGRTHIALGELVEARDALLGVGRIPVKAQESQNTAAARVEADRLARELEPRIPTLTVTFEGTPAGASPTLAIDGQPVAAASIGGPRRLNPGTHHVLARVAGAKDVTSEVTLAEGETRTATLHFVPAAAPTKDASPSKESIEERHVSPWVWVGFGAAAASFAVGGVTGAMTLSKRAQLDDACPERQCGPSHQDDLRSAKTLGTISTISFVAAGAFTVVGVIGLFDSGPRRAQVSVGASGVSIAGVF
jgi:hypothetical protein